MDPGARARAQRLGRAARGERGAIARSADAIASRAKTDQRNVRSAKSWAGIVPGVALSRPLSLQLGFFFFVPRGGGIFAELVNGWVDTLGSPSPSVKIIKYHFIHFRKKNLSSRSSPLPAVSASSLAPRKAASS